MDDAMTWGELAAVGVGFCVVTGAAGWLVGRFSSKTAWLRAILYFVGAMQVVTLVVDVISHGWTNQVENALRLTTTGAMLVGWLAVRAGRRARRRGGMVDPPEQAGGSLNEDPFAVPPRRAWVPVVVIGAASVAGMVYGILGARDPGPDRLPAISFVILSLGFLPLPVVTAWQRLGRRRMTRRLGGMVNISAGLGIGLGSFVLAAGSAALAPGERTLYAVAAVLGVGFVVHGALIWAGRITPGGTHPRTSLVEGMPAGSARQDATAGADSNPEPAD